jgi:hypothetical protein
VAVPAAPVIVARHNSGAVVRVTIPAVTGATSYKLYRDDYPTAATTLIASGLSAGYNYDLVPDVAKYNYRAKATNADGDSAFSNSVAVKVVDVDDGSPTAALRINRSR